MRPLHAHLSVHFPTAPAPPVFFFQEYCLPARWQLLDEKTRQQLKAAVYPDIFESRSTFVNFMLPIVVAACGVHGFVWAPTDVHFYQGCGQANCTFRVIDACVSTPHVRYTTCS